MNDYHLNDFMKLSKKTGVDLGELIKDYEEFATMYINKECDKPIWVWYQAKPQYEKAYLKTMEKHK